MTVKSLRIGTRGSPLALAQTHMVRAPSRPGAWRRGGTFRNRDHQDDRRSDPGSSPVGIRRQRALHERTRHCADRRRHRLRRSFLQGSADPSPGGNRHRGLSAARGRARRLDRPRGRDDRRASSRRRGGHRLAAPRRAGEAPASRSANDPASRQCPYAPRQGRERRGRRDAARARRAEASRPRRSRDSPAPDRRFSAGRRTGRHRDHRAGEGRRDPRGAGSYPR